MTRVLARKTVAGFVPADEVAQIVFRRVPLGKPCYIEIVAARNPKQHRLCFALLNVMVEHGEFPSTEAALNALKIATGHFDLAEQDGKTIYLLRSISYANMRGVEFSEWFDAAVKVVVERWLPGVKSEELRAELEQMVGS
jgi:hypothetical protein